MIDLKVVQPDPYDAVLADLRVKREAIDNAIVTLESLRDGRLGIAPAPAASDPQQGPIEDAGMFLGMSIADAAKKLLKMRKRTLGNAEILKELQAGGLVLTGADPLNVIGSVLTRRFNNMGDIVRVGRGVWGLKEWYPGRNFKPAAKTSLTGIEGTLEGLEEAIGSGIDLGVVAPDDDETP
jgi:hypothetical protein